MSEDPIKLLLMAFYFMRFEEFLETAEDDIMISGEGGVRGTTRI